MHSRIEDCIAENYADLSQKLKDAADYVVSNQMDVASRSLRAISTESGVSPATLSRLARTLKFATYEDLREVCRQSVTERGHSFADRAEQLHLDPTDQPMIERQAAACIRNITTMVDTIEPDRLQQAVAALHGAGRVVLFGAFGSAGLTEYMTYMANYFGSNWTLIESAGVSLGSTVGAIGPGDVLLIVTKSPYAQRAVRAAEIAKAADANVIVITDSHICPAIEFSTHSFIVASDSPQFFSSYTATLVLIETIIAMLVALSGETASRTIRAVEENNQRLGEFWLK